MNKAHDVIVLSFTGPLMKMNVDGRDYEIDLTRQSMLLAKATQEQRERVEITPSGYGLHWPDLDEDLSIDGLIGAKHQAPLAETGA